MSDREQALDSDHIDEQRRMRRHRYTYNLGQEQELAAACGRVRKICNEIPKQEALRKTNLSNIIGIYCRTYKDMMLRKIAGIAKDSYSAVRALLHNENRSLSLETYTKLSGALDVPLMHFLGLIPEEDYKSPLIDIHIYEYPYNLNVNKK